MDFRTFEAKKDDSGRRLDRVIRKFIPEKNLSGLYKAVRKGFIKLNGKKTKPDERISSGDEIQVADFLLNPNCPEKAENKTETPEKNLSQGNTSGTGKKNGIGYISRSKSEKAGITDKFREKTENLRNTNLKIVFQDQNLLFIEKPYGITVHGKENSLDNAVKDLYRKTAEKTSLSFLPGPLHRLDERTTGLIAFSWSLSGAKWFSENIKNHSIRKEYIAVVQGKLEAAQTWKDFIDSKNKSEAKSEARAYERSSRNGNLEKKESKYGYGKNERNNGEENQFFRKVKISSEKKNEDYKETLTEAVPLSYGKADGTAFTLVKFTIKTGRTHQIRAQSAFHGFPLLGDSAYGGKKIAESACKREFFLHAFRLSFPENRISLPEKIECPLGNDFLDFLKTNNCGTENISL